MVPLASCIHAVSWNGGSFSPSWLIFDVGRFFTEFPEDTGFSLRLFRNRRNAVSARPHRPHEKARPLPFLLRVSRDMGEPGGCRRRALLREVPEEGSESQRLLARGSRCDAVAERGPSLRLHSDCRRRLGVWTRFLRIHLSPQGRAHAGDGVSAGEAGADGSRFVAWRFQPMPFGGTHDRPRAMQWHAALDDRHLVVHFSKIGCHYDARPGSLASATRLSLRWSYSSALLE